MLSRRKKILFFIALILIMIFGPLLAGEIGMRLYHLLHHKHRQILFTRLLFWIYPIPRKLLLLVGQRSSSGILRAAQNKFVRPFRKRDPSG